MITSAQNLVLSRVVLEPTIERASCHVVLNQCLCRRSDHCQSYPREIGCLFLGDAPGRIDPALGKTIHPEEAIIYVNQAIAIGLIPMIVHSAFDAELLGIDFRRMLAVCFCCDCCCTVRRNLRSRPAAFGGTVLRFPGLHEDVGLSCNGFGECLDVCHTHALGINNGRLVISDACKGCGRCAQFCPRGAISVYCDNDNQALLRLFSIVEKRTTIW